jgi:hypothetical protein
MVSQVGHERVADEKHAAGGQIHQQAIVRLAAMDGVDPEFHAPDGQRFGLGDELVRYDVILGLSLAAEEVAEGHAGLVDALLFQPEARLGDRLHARGFERGQPADVIPVGVGQDDAGDPLRGERPQGAPGRLGMGHRRTGVDGDETFRRGHKADVPEVKALGHPHAGRRFQHARLAEVVAVLGRHPAIGEKQRLAVVQRGISRALQGLTRFTLMPEGRVSFGKPSVHRPAQARRKVLLVLQHPFEVRDRHSGLVEPRGKLRQHQPAKEAG